MSPRLRRPTELPGVVRRHLEFAGVADDAIPETVRMRQSGDIRLRPDQRWAHFVVAQRYTTAPPGFVREARVKSSPLVTVRAHDRFVEGVAHSEVWPVRSWRSVDAVGPEVDQDATVRYMSDMAWFPAAFRAPWVSWEPIDDQSATMTVTIGGTMAHALVRFAATGAIESMEADRFLRIGRKRWDLVPWSIAYGAEATMADALVPLTADATWHLDSGSFPYIRLRIEDLRYV